MPRSAYIEVDGRKEYPDSISVSGDPAMRVLFQLHFPERLPRGMGRRSQKRRLFRIIHVTGRIQELSVVVDRTSRNYVSATIRLIEDLTIKDTTR